MFELLELLKLTPSGGNQQAWNIHVNSNNQLHIVELSIKVPEQPDYTDAFSFGRLISLGMLQYSISYLAADLNLKILESKLDNSNTKKTPKIQIKIEELSQEKNLKNSQRIKTFTNRFTNRGLYLDKAIDSSLLENIKTNNPTLSILTKEECFKAIELQSKLSLIRFQNKFLFKEMMSEITKTPEETGIPLSHLGLNFLMRCAILLSKQIPLTFPLDFLYRYPIHQSITVPMSKSAHICVLSETSDDLTSWINLGYNFMKTWLELTEHNIHLQPIGNSLILSNYFQNTKAFNFSTKHQSLLHDLEFFKANNNLLDLKKPNIFFRIGYSDKGFLKTPRKNIDPKYQMIGELMKLS